MEQEMVYSNHDTKSVETEVMTVLRMSGFAVTTITHFSSTLFY